MAEPLVSVSGVSERDIDLLLLEEFMASQDFVDWFLGAVGLAGSLELEEATRSATDSIGESDLLLVFLDLEGQRHGLLIENKISASFQPRQAARYKQRASLLRTNSGYASSMTVLVAPMQYLSKTDDKKGFDEVVSYEQIVEWFEESDGTRAAYKVYMLSSAIEKAVKGYLPVEDAAVTRFWAEYWKLSLTVAPELQMREPKGKPSSSSFVLFRPVGLPPGVVMVHKMTHGNLDIQFSSLGHNLEELIDKYGQSLEEGMYITRAGKSGVIRQRVTPVSPSGSFETQEEILNHVLVKAARMLGWFSQVK